MDCVKETELAHLIQAVPCEVGPHMREECEHAYSCAWWVTWPCMTRKKLTRADLMAFSIACEGGIVFW